MLCGSRILPLLLAASIFPEVPSMDTLYHIPYACSVMHVPTVALVGACSILDTTKVLVSVDNFNQLVNDTKRKYTYSEVIRDIEVHAGSNYMNPKVVSPQPRTAQSIMVKDFYVSLSPNSWQRNPGALNNSGIECDAFGVAYNVGILALMGAFVFSPYVQPILVTPHIKRKTRLEVLRTGTVTYIPRRPCVTYSWSQTLNRIRYHEVLELPRETCLNTFCMYLLSKCNAFPTKNYLFCAKSTRFSDVCPNARGAALYCNHFYTSIYGIMTSAPSCGVGNMPGVYTQILSVTEFYERVFRVGFYVDHSFNYSIFGLPQRADDY